MKKLLAALLILALLSLSWSTVPVYAKEKVLVKEGSINARSGPGTHYDIVGKVDGGEVYTVQKKEKDWLKIQLPSGEKAWIASWLTEKAGKQEKEEGHQAAPYAKITASSLYIHEKPSLASKTIGTVTKGDTFSILKRENHWVQIQWEKNQKGWLPGWLVESVMKHTSAIHKNSKITVKEDGVALREKANASSPVKKWAKKGDTFDVVGVKKNYYEVKTGWGKTAFVAGWLVEADNKADQISPPDSLYDLTGKLILIDPGHGGNDSGTIGKNGTLEKNLTLSTAKRLKEKLESSGANVILTRNNDVYVALSERTDQAFAAQPDAFISIHDDSAEQSEVQGITPYYYHSYQKQLAKAIYQNLEEEGTLTIRDERFGDYHVLRQNSQPAILLELGYLSNPDEEDTVTSPAFQGKAVNAIYEGISQYLTGIKYE